MLILFPLQNPGERLKIFVQPRMRHDEQTARSGRWGHVRMAGKAGAVGCLPGLFVPFWPPSLFLFGIASFVRPKNGPRDDAAFEALCGFDRFGAETLRRRSRNLTTPNNLVQPCYARRREMRCRARVCASRSREARRRSGRPAAHFRKVRRQLSSDRSAATAAPGFPSCVRTRLFRAPRLLRERAPEAAGKDP